MKRRKSKGERKAESIRVRLTASQKELFTKAAKRAGLDLSGWFRWLAMREVASGPSSEKE